MCWIFDRYSTVWFADAFRLVDISSRWICYLWQLVDEPILVLHISQLNHQMGHPTTWRLKSRSESHSSFMGLILGEFVVGSIWSILGIIVGQPMYRFLY